MYKKKFSVKGKTGFYGISAVFVFCLLCTAFSSCSSIVPWFPSKEGWAEKPGEEIRGTIAEGTISVDTLSSWESLEKEIAGILPFLFLEKGYAFKVKQEPAEKKEGNAAASGNTGQPSSGGTAFFADISLIEREYMEGWKTKHSLSAEVRIRNGRQAILAAGRAMISGEKSFASSKTTSDLLRIAIAKALSSLEENAGGNKL